MYGHGNNINGSSQTVESKSSHQNCQIIKDIKFGTKNINLRAIILILGKPVVTKSGQTVCTCRIADKSGSIDLSLWDEMCKLLKPGDVIYIHNAYATGFKGKLSLNIGRGGTIEKYDELCFAFEDQPYLSELPMDTNMINNNSHATTTTTTTITTNANAPLLTSNNNNQSISSNLNKKNDYQTSGGNVFLNEIVDPRKSNALSDNKSSISRTLQVIPPTKSRTDYVRNAPPIMSRNNPSIIQSNSNASNNPNNSFVKKVPGYNVAQASTTSSMGSSTNSHTLTTENIKYTPRDPRLKNS